MLSIQIFLLGLFPARLKRFLGAGDKLYHLYGKNFRNAKNRGRMYIFPSPINLIGKGLS